MVRGVLALTGGYAVIAILLLLTEAALESHDLVNVHLPPAMLYGMVGGWTAAWMWPGKELLAGVGLAGFAVIMTVFSMAVGIAGHSDLPLWFWPVRVLLMIPGALVGAVVRYRQARKQRA